MRIYQRSSGNGNGSADRFSVLSEIIGRQASPFEYRYRSWQTLDKTIPTYEFWDNLRRGKAVGYEFAGLFCRPITEVVAAHVLGRTMLARLQTNPDLPQERREYTDRVLARLCSRSMGQFFNMLVDLYALGDQYIIVNADGSFSVPSPDTVTAEYDPLDYRKLQAVTVTSRFDRYEITDRYTAETRTLRIKHLRTADGYRAGQVEEREYPNLIGRLPVVHFANDRGTNETHGRPIYEALLRLLSRYDDLIEKGLDGAELMGNPVPVLSGLDDVEATQQQNEPLAGAETYSDAEGNEATRDLFNFDTRAGMLLRGGAKFEFVSPNSKFTDDIRSMLELLFLLQLDHTRLPEALWGGAISSSKASAEVQMPPFYQFIEGERLALEGEGADNLLGTQAEGGFLALFDIWLRTRRLTDPDILVEPVEIVWDDLAEMPQDIRFQWATWLRQMKLLSGETALALSGLVEDVSSEIEAVKQEIEAAKQEDQFDQQLMNALKMLAQGSEVKPVTSEPEQ